MKLFKYLSYQEPLPPTTLGKIWYHVKWLLIGVVLGFILGWIFLSA